MKLLLDNCVHYRAKSLFPRHEVLHARDVGWRALANGELLRQASQQFDVLVTTDKNIRNEHNLSTLPISVLELNTRFTRIEDLKTLAPFLEAAVEACVRYRFVSVRPDGTMDRLGEVPKK